MKRLSSLIELHCFTLLVVKKKEEEKPKLFMIQLIKEKEYLR
jgi:hypothetical protein